MCELLPKHLPAKQLPAKHVQKAQHLHCNISTRKGHRTKIASLPSCIFVSNLNNFSVWMICRSWYRTPPSVELRVSRPSELFQHLISLQACHVRPIAPAGAVACNLERLPSVQYCNHNQLRGWCLIFLSPLALVLFHWTNFLDLGMELTLC